MFGLSRHVSRNSKFTDDDVSGMTPPPMKHQQSKRQTSRGQSQMFKTQTTYHGWYKLLMLVLLLMVHYTEAIPILIEDSSNSDNKVKAIASLSSSSSSSILAEAVADAVARTQSEDILNNSGLIDSSLLNTKLDEGRVKKKGPHAIVSKNGNGGGRQRKTQHQHQKQQNKYTLTSGNSNKNSKHHGSSNQQQHLSGNPLNNRKIFRADPNLQRLEKKSWKIPIKAIALYSENSKDLQTSQMIGDLNELFETFKDS